MALVDPYRKFVSDLPATPNGATGALTAVLCPDDEPHLDAHSSSITQLDEWLQFPTQQPGRFPADLTVPRSDLRVWASVCALRWSNRYRDLASRAELRDKAVSGTLTTSLVTTLAVVGIDGDVDTIDEWVATGLAGLARVGIPVSLAATRIKAQKNERLFQDLRKNLQ